MVVARDFNPNQTGKPATRSRVATRTIRIVMRSMTFYEAATVKRLSCFFWN